MTRPADYDVLICGAGASGLTLAIDFARRGISFRLIDKLDEPFKGSRGKGVQPRTLEIFEDLGVLNRVAASGGPYPTRRLYRADGSHQDSEVMENPGVTPSEPYCQTLMIPQFLTERVMRNRLAELGHSPEFGYELIEFEQDEDGVTARIASKSGEETLRARWLIGADGGRSFVRKSLGIDFPGKTLGVRALVADVTMTGFSRDFWHCFNDANPRQIMFCPLAGTDMFQIQGPIPLEGDIDLSPEGLTAIAAERTGRSDIKVQSVSWASAYSMNARLANTYRKGRVFLVGDSAHAHPPTGGQGLNTSVQDAFNLSWKLDAVINGAPGALLDTYEEERRPVAAGMLGLATKLLDEQKAGKMERGREVKQLDIGYPDTSLKLGTSQRTSGPMAGNRAPDAPTTGAAGQRLRLFDLFKGPHWTLLGYKTELSAIPSRTGLHIHTFGSHGDMIDDGGHFSNAYAPSAGDWFLIRPDGYIAAIVNSADIGSLETYFPALGIPSGQ